MKANLLCIWLLVPVLLACDSHVESPSTSVAKENITGIISKGLLNARWFALGNSDFDSYLADNV
jgi:hypothetical protein